MAPDPVIGQQSWLNGMGKLSLESLSLPMMPPLGRFKGYRPKGIDDFLHVLPVNDGNLKLSAYTWSDLYTTQ